MKEGVEPVQVQALQSKQESVFERMWKFFFSYQRKKLDIEMDGVVSFPSILELPPEIQYLFFTLLNPKDLSNASRVCKPWRSLALLDCFWERLYYRDFSYLFNNAPAPPTPAKRELVRTTWGSWKELYKTTYIETSRSKVYSSFTTHLSCPSLSYCRFWQEWKEYEQKESSSSIVNKLLPPRLTPRGLNPFAFTPSTYHFFQPYHNSNHLSPKTLSNYFRATHCFFFEPYWFWFFFSPSNKTQPSQILLLLSAIFLPLTLLPVFLILSLVYWKHLPLGLLCYSFPWVPPEVMWPTPLLLAMSQAIAGPLSIWSTLALLHKNPYDLDKTRQDMVLKAITILMNVLMVQFILSSWGVSMLGAILQVLLLFCCITPCFFALTSNPVNNMKVALSGVPFLFSIYFAAEWFGVMASLFFMFALPIWSCLLPQRKRRTGDRSVIAELQSMRWYNTNCCIPSLYLLVTLPPAYLVIGYYAYYGKTIFGM